MANEFIIKKGFISKANSVVSGSLIVTEGFSGSFSGSFEGDGSGLTNLPASSPFPFSGDAQITGSLLVSGSGVQITGSLDVDSAFIQTITPKDGIFIIDSPNASAYGNFSFQTHTPSLGAYIKIKYGADEIITKYSANQAYAFGKIGDTTNSFEFNGGGNPNFSLLDTVFITQGATQNNALKITGSVLLLGENSHITASGNVSSSAASTASFGTYLGDGSQLTGIASSTNLTQSLFVTPSGNDGTAVVGDIHKPFQTILGATGSANIGDTIIVYPGTYYTNTNIIKDGVNYYFYPGSHITGSAPVIDVSLTYPANIRGYGKFETKYNGRQIYLTAPEGYFEFDRIEGKGILSSGTGKNVLSLEQTGDDTQVLTVEGTVIAVDPNNNTTSAISFGQGNIMFKGNAINSGSQGRGVTIASDSSDVSIEGYIYSLNGTAYYDIIRHICTTFKGRIETGDQSNFDAIFISDGYSQGGYFDGEIIGSIDIDTGEVGNAGVTINGNQQCTNSPSSQGAVHVEGGYNVFNHKIIASENIFTIKGGHNIFNGQANITSDFSGKIFDIQGGTLIYDGITGDISKRAQSNTISGGTLIINSYLEHYGATFPNDTDMFDLSGGTLEINDKVKHFQATSGSGIINMTGGYLKLNSAQLISDTPGAALHAIYLNNSSHSGSIFNNSWTNIPAVFQSGSFTNEITGGGTLFYSDKLY